MTELLSDDTLCVLQGYVDITIRSEDDEPTLVHYALLKNYASCLFGLQDAHRKVQSRISKKAIDVWARLGVQLGLDGLLGLSRKAQKLLSPPPWKACHYDNCVCNDMNPCHKLKV